MRHQLFLCWAVALSLGMAGRATAQTDAPAATAVPAASPGTIVPTASATPSDFVIGADDVLSVYFWREKDMSADVVVRPDGNISLPLLNDVKAVGLTPEQLRQKLIELASQFIEDPNATVVVKQINSRRVFITGSIAKPGPYPLTSPTTVVQLIALAGGLLEYADKDNIVIVHAEKRPDGEPWTSLLKYSEVMKRKNIKQNLELKPGDTVIVP